jgi:hypothetical protein
MLKYTVVILKKRAYLGAIDLVGIAWSGNSSPSFLTKGYVGLLSFLDARIG